MILKITLLIVFFAVTVGVGIYCRKNSTDVNGFVLGGRSVGPWLTAFAFGTSYFSAVIFVGYAGQFGWNFGVASTWIGLGNAFIGSLMAWVILGRRTRLMTQKLDSRTMPDFFEHRYQSKGLKLFASLVVFVFLIPYTASLFNGLSRLFEMAFPGVDYAVCVVVMAILTGIYVIIGGYVATAVNDFIQGIIMLGGIVAVIAAVLSQNGGLTGSLVALAEKEAVTPSGEVFPGGFASFLGPDPLFLLVVVLLTSLGTWGLPQMVGKFYAIRDEASVRKGTIISTVFAIVVAGGCYFIGGFGRLFISPETVAAEGFDVIIPAMLNGMPDLLIAVVLVLVLSASMSTLSSLVLTSGSTITLDLIVPASKGKMTEKGKMNVMRVMIALFILVSAVIAIVQAKSKVVFIAQLMGVSWGALAGAFLAPFLYGLFHKKVTRTSVYVSFTCGVVISLVQLAKSLTGFSFGVELLDGFLFKTSLHSGVVAMLLGLVLVPLASLLTRKSCPKGVEEMFACYDEKVVSTAKKSLGE
ncbi:MAG: sodium:solute symporter [Clostridia bacterium]|nr:sodium:solute symporter [Clostridia bacterium]